jgi:hypothetical protein
MRNGKIVALMLGIGAAVVSAQAAEFPGSMTNSAPRASAINQSGTFGLGLMLGEPIGLTAKFWANDFVAVDGGLGWSFVEPDGTQLHADALFHKFDPFRTDTHDLALYAGAGLRLKFPDHGDTHVGIRFPVGAAYLLPEHNLEFYAEIAPILDVTPDVRLAWNGGIGIRYYFK